MYFKSIKLSDNLATKAFKETKDLKHYRLIFIVNHIKSRNMYDLHHIDMVSKFDSFNSI